MKEFKKLNGWQRFLLKSNSSVAYKDYRFLEALQGISHPQLRLSGLTEIHFLHNGHAGDLIYSLPAIYALAEGRPVHIHLRINYEVKYGKMKHPLGNVTLNEKMVAMLQPLLHHQPQIQSCDVYTNQKIDVDLNAFRQYPFNYRTGHISRWYFWAFGISGNLTRPWLQAAPDTSVTDAIVIARSQRYRQPGIDYRFLQQYPRAIFIGVPEEYDDMKVQIPNLEYRPVVDFAEMASVIQGSMFFIGNQSAPFAIAEGLKKRRLLEVYYLSPNVVVEGREGYDFLYQPQFEKLVQQLWAGGNR